jgi:dihydrofolate synthase/folylpolyglutamate synthase
MEVLLQRLGNPHLAVPTVHVAGSKGKGSTAAMIASILTAGGWRTGLYTSPHLHVFPERIRVDMALVPRALFADLIEELWPHAEAIERRGDLGRVSVFEMLTAMAFQHFRTIGADVQVVEVGLGGRLDATNLVQPEVAVITPVSLDHVAVLGNTIGKIAVEKAGIIKPGAPVVIGRQPKVAHAVLQWAARSRGAVSVDALRRVGLARPPGPERPPSIVLSGRAGEYETTLPLLGAHQVDNARTAVAAVETLVERMSSRGRLALGADAVERGLASVCWPARAEVLTDGPPPVIVDGAHNASSAAAFARMLQAYFPAASGIVLIYAGSGGHDFAATARQFSALAPRVIVTRTRHPKAVAPETVAEALRCDNVAVVAVTESTGAALAAARATAGPRDLIVGAGSLFAAAEIREAVLGIEPELYPDLRGELTAPYAAERAPA